MRPPLPRCPWHAAARRELTPCLHTLQIAVSMATHAEALPENLVYAVKVGSMQHSTMQRKAARSRALLASWSSAFAS